MLIYFFNIKTTYLKINKLRKILTKYLSNTIIKNNTHIRKYLMEKINNIFSIYNETEYVELRNNNPISNTNLKKSLLETNNAWRFFNREIKKDIDNSSYFFKNISDWQKKLDNFLNIHSKFPSIDNFASLVLSSNINQYHLLPYKNQASTELLEFYGFHKPNLLLKISNSEYTFGLRNIKQNNEKTKINKEFKIIRIIKNNKSEFIKHGSFIFLDLKVRNLENLEIFNTVLALPEFWRNFHFISRKPIKEKDKYHPIYQTNNYFTSFYNPSNQYGAEHTYILNNNEIIKNINLKNMELTIFSLASQLIFMQPGLIMPLTEQEQNYTAEYGPDYIIKLEKDDKNTHLISINIPADLIHNYFNTFSNDFSKREQLFANHFDMINYSGGQYIATSNNQIVFNYEKNMVCLFESLTKIDHNQLN